MGVPVLILGESGSGKSASMRNFKKDEIGIFNIAGKPLPFKNDLQKWDNATYSNIYKGLSESEKKIFVIDDSQYLMAFEMFDRAKETGYTKFTDVALDFRNLIHYITTKSDDDVIVYMLHHTETDENGKIKAKTSGKMLDNQLTVEGLFSIVLLARTDGNRHYFETNSDGYANIKSPMDMFEREIDNDLKFVDTAIRDYYELNKKDKSKSNTKENKEEK